MGDTPTDRGADSFSGLLTQDEAVEILRLDRLGLRNPKETLRYLRRTSQLGFVRIAGKVMIPREDIDDYVQRHRVRPRQQPD